MQQLHVEKANECVEVGEKDLIQSQEDSQLQTLFLTIRSIMPHESGIRLYVEQVRQALNVTALRVNTARQEKELPHIEFDINFNNNKYIT